MSKPVQVSTLGDIFIVLGTIYAVLLVVTVIQFIRITHIRRYPLRKLSTQKGFLFLLGITCIVRVVFFYVITFTHTSGATFDLGKFNVELFTILDDFACLSFFTTFLLLILFWVEILYHSKNKTRLYRSKIRPIFFLMVGIVYLIQIIIWICIFVMPDHQELMDQIDNTYYSALSLLAGIGFCYYGFKLSQKLIRNPINSPGKKRKLIEVIIFTLLCTICFLGRSISFLIISYYKSLDVNYTSIVIYYSVTEIIPSIFVIFLFRKMPPRPSIAQSFRPESSINDDTIPILSEHQNQNV